jgi:hypothetical protein
MLYPSGIYVTERCVAQARNRTAVVQKLPDFVAAPSHDFKPMARDLS